MTRHPKKFGVCVSGGNSTALHKVACNLKGAFRVHDTYFPIVRVPQGV